jgi:hypothetical protein
MLPAPAAMPHGCAPSRAVPVTLFVFGLTRLSVALL